MGLELTVEIVEHDPRFDNAGAIVDIQRYDAVKMFREIDNDAVIDGLAALRGATATRCYDPAVVAADRQCPQRLIDGFGNDHARGHDLVERGVGRVAAAIETVEQDLTRHLVGELVLQCC